MEQDMGVADKSAGLPAVFWYLRDRCEFPFAWRLYAAWKMLVAPNSMSAAIVLHGHARLARDYPDGGR